MNILDIIASNLRNAPVTKRFPDTVAVPAAFRGPVKIDSEQCIACGTCSYVCPSGAITLVDHEDHFHWSYEPGRCTYCARCADLCPAGALAMEEKPAPIYTRAGELRHMSEIKRPVCTQCGAPIQPLNDKLLHKAFPEVTDEIRALNRLCDRCRRRHHQRALVMNWPQTEE